MVDAVPKVPDNYHSLGWEGPAVVHSAGLEDGVFPDSWGPLAVFGIVANQVPRKRLG